MKKSSIIALICSLLLAALMAAGCTKGAKKQERPAAPSAPSVSSLVTGDGSASPTAPGGEALAGQPESGGGNPFVQPPAPSVPRQEAAPSGGQAPPPASPAPGRPPLPGGPAGAVPGGVPVERDTARALRQVRLPVYPGARTEEGALMGDPPGAKPGTFRASVVRISTGDGFDRVLEFYRRKMPGAHVEEAKREGKRQAVLVLPDRKTGEMQMAQLIEAGPRVQVLLSRAKTPPAPKPEDRPFTVDRDAGAALKRVGLPLYPDATMEGGATETDRKNPAISRAVVVLVTDDPVSKVLEFYRKELPGAREDQREIEGTSVHRLIRQDASTGGGVSVTVASVEGKTRCALMRVNLPPKTRKD